MKKQLKRIVALILATAMLTSLLCVDAWASNTDSMELAETEVEASGTGSVGTLIAQEIDSQIQTQQQAEESDANISDLEVEGTTATVTLSTTVDCDVVVAIYPDGDMTTMVASGTTSIQAHSTTATVEITSGTMPTYYIAAAYLAEKNSHEPVCEETISYLHTKDMQEFLSKTVEDFSEEQVVNLDDNSNTNFAVLNDNVEQFHQTDGTTSKPLTIQETSKGTYTVTNATDEFKALKVGDTFTYDGGDNELLIIKVKSISIKGNTVTIVEDENIDVAEVFDFLRIESIEGEGTATVDNSNLPKGVTVDNGIEAQAWEDEISGTAISANYKWDFKNGNYDSKYLTLSGSVGAQVGVNLGYKLKYYISHDCTEFRFSVDIKGNFKLQVSGSMKGNIPLGKMEFSPVLGVFIVITPSAVAELEGSADVSATVTAALKWSYDSQSNKGLQFKPSIDTSVDTSGEISLFLGFSLEPKLKIISDKIADSGLEATVGTIATLTAWNGSTSPADDIHSCSSCIDGDINFSCQATGSIKLWNKWKFSMSPFNITHKLSDWYKSFTYGDKGLKKCPHIAYKCTFTLQDATKTLLKNAEITGIPLSDNRAFDGKGKNLTSTPKSNDKGQAVVYLVDGNYTICGQQLTIHGAGKSVLITVSGTVIKTDKCGSNVTYKLYDNGILYISGTGDMDDYEQYGAPYYSSFYYRAIKKVIIEEGVTSIGNYAFCACQTLNSVTIPNSVTSIGDYAFYACQTLKSITIPSSVTLIGNNAFQNCRDLSSITISNGVTSIGNYTFDSCVSLSSITIPNSVISIGDFAFQSCRILKSITLSNSVTSIGNYTFDSCVSLSSIAIPNSVISIGKSAFSDCNSLSSITIPNSVTSIGDNAFLRCSNLSSITIPNSITSIGNYAFSECNSLSSITIPNSVTSIGNYAFCACETLCSITIPNSITNISDGVFWNCVKLSSITIPNSVTSIGKSAFSDCISLSGIPIPNSVISIGERAFYGCVSLSSITIPNSVTSIGELLFARNDYLKNIYYAGTKAQWSAIDKKWRIPSGTTIHYNSSGITTQSEEVQDDEESIVDDTPTEQRTEETEETEQTEEIPEGSSSVSKWTPDPEEAIPSDFADREEQEQQTGGDASSTLEPLHAYTGTSRTSGDTRLALFSGLAPNKEYLFVVAKDLEQPFNTLLYIIQQTSDAKGELRVSYCVPAEYANASFRAYGQLKELKANTITAKNKTLTASTSKTQYWTIGATVLDNAKLTYQSNNSAVKVDANGKVTVPKNFVGTVEITITADETSVYSATTKTVTLTVKPIANTITASNKTLTVKTTGTQTVSLSAKVKDKAKLTYKSDNKSITVDSKGKVTVKKGYVGKATITITAAATKNYAKTTKKVTVTVNKAKQPMTVSPASKTYKVKDVAKKAQTLTLKASKAQGKVTFKSNNTNYVTVSSKGKVTLKKGTPKGKYTITVTAAGNGLYDKGSKTVKITVK